MTDGSLPQARLKSAMNLNIALGVGGAVWFTVASPQAIFNIFYKNHLGASSTQLGILVGVLQATALFNLVSIFLYGSTPRRKPIWIVSQALHRLFGLVLAYVALQASRIADYTGGINLIFYTMAASWILMNVSGSGWWSWIADLFPEKIRARFFGKRSAVISGVNIAWFFTATVLMDASRNIYIVYFWIFLIAGILGTLEVVLHVFMPEPLSQTEKPKINLSAFLQPLRDRNFMIFSVAIGILLFSINVFSPFAPPFLTDPQNVGAPNTWIGIMFVISQLAWLTVVPSWGIVMDRYGRKPVVIIGSLFTISWFGYFAVTSLNYMYVLPAIALVAGLLAPAFWEGINQMMLTLTPQKHRIAYVSWYMTFAGLISAVGAYTGGLLLDAFADVEIHVTSSLTFSAFHVVLAISLGLIGISIGILLTIREGKQKPVGFVMASLARPGVFRTFVNIGILAGTANSARVVRALRSVGGAGHHIALEEVVARLEDPDQEVREESARALGRIGSPEAVDTLIDHMRDRGSSIRPIAARALGSIGDKRALRYLIQGLADPSEDLQDACARALGSFSGDESVSHLLNLFREERSERVLASGAESISRLGFFEAAWEILPRMHGATNRILRRQLATAMSNLLGKPGEFYRYVTGSVEQRETQVTRLFQEARRNVGAIAKKLGQKGRNSENQREWAAAADSLRRLRVFFQDERYHEALDTAIEAATRIAHLVLAFYKDGVDSLPAGPTNLDELIDTAFKVDTHLGVWVWFLSETDRIKDTLDEDAKMIDAMLIIFFISAYKRV